MPALPDAPQVYRVDFHHLESGDPSLANRSFWKFSGSGASVSDMDTFATYVSTSWGSALKSLANDSVELKEVVCTDLTSATSSRGSWTGTIAGTRGSDLLPDGVCTLLNFSVSRRYRGGKPRMYPPWGNDSDLASGSAWSSGFIGDVNAGWAAFTALMIGHDIGATSITEQVNVSYYAGVEPPITLPSGRVKQANAPRTATEVDQIVSYACNPIPGSQRRRYRA